MRKALALLMAILWAIALNAQNGNVPAPTTYILQVDSHNGEAFSVFLDGDLQNRLPQTRVIVNEVSDKTHEIVVVLKRPVEKCAVLQLRPHERTVQVAVNYDSRLEQLYLYTASRNRADTYDLPVAQTPVVQPRQVGLPQERVQLVDASKKEMREAEDDEVLSMILRLKAQPFDTERLALAKVLVASTRLKASQIASLAATLDYSNSRVEFLKYAYAYCLDPTEYYSTVDVLSFTADKKKVLDYVATQK